MIDTLVSMGLNYSKLICWDSSYQYLIKRIFNDLEENPNYHFINFMYFFNLTSFLNFLYLWIMNKISIFNSKVSAKKKKNCVPFFVVYVVPLSILPIYSCKINDKCASAEGLFIIFVYPLPN